MQLKDYIGEATAYDKKLMLERKDPTSWLKSVSAFANTQGGRLLFGVANDGALVGLADAQGDAEFISEAIKAQMDPVPVIADLFQRLDLMERRGSGFKKVLDAYAFESEKRGVSIRPESRSARSAFFAVLPNLNYGHSIGQVTGHVAGQATGQVTNHAADHVDEDSILVLKEIANVLPCNVARLLRILKSEMDIHQILTKIRFSSRAHLRKSALYPALEMGLVEMTQPNSPRSPTQKYRLTGKGKAVAKMSKGCRK